MVTGTTRPRLPTAKWGAACGTCAAAKAKCLRTSGTAGSKCDRCERLLKDCTDQVHRPRKKRTSKPSKTSQIEEKLNGLYSLLRASGSLNSAGLPSDTLSVPDDLNSILSSSKSPESFGSSSSSKTWTIPSSFNSDAPATCICRPDCSEAPPPPGTDDELLDIFRDELQDVCPFVVIPADMSAATLKVKRPFLMAAIKMVASYRSLRSMRAQMFHLMKYVSEHTLIRCERSLDLLLGILVIVQWYPYHFCTHSQLGTLVAMASSLCSQLGLIRRPRASERIGLRLLKAPEINPRTNEERRAYVGAWFLSSVCSLGFWRMEAMTHTRYLDECLNDLLVNSEYETDIKLVYLVRAQCLAHRIDQLHNRDTDMEDVDGPPLPSVAALQVELDGLRNSLSPELQGDDMIQMHLNTAAMKLHEPPIVDPSTITSLCAALAISGPEQSWPLEGLQKSRDALVQWFDHWLSIPPSLFYQETTGGAAQLTYAIIMLGRWTKLTTPRGMLKAARAKSHDLSLTPSVKSAGACIQGPQLSSKDEEPLLAVPGSMRSAAKVPFNFRQVTSRQEADPRLPLELANLRSHIEAQPGLSIDVPVLISSIISRFEQVNAALQDLSVEPGKISPNIWMMGAIRVRVTRANLERWAELITEGIQKANLNDDSTADAETPAKESVLVNNAEPFVGVYEDTWNGMALPEQVSMQDYFQADGMAHSFDPHLAMDRSWDWDMLYNSMGEFMEP